MRVFAQMWAAALALIAMNAAAFGQGVTIDQPRQGVNEFAGPRTVITFSVDAGLDGLALTAGQPLLVEVRRLQPNGSLLGAAVTATILGGPVNYNNAGVTGLQIDLRDRLGNGTNSPVFTAAQWAQVANLNGVISLRVFTAGDGGATTEFDSEDEAADQTLRADNTGPRIISAQVSPDGALLLITFDEPLRVAASGDTANDDNQTVVGNITGADFQTNTVNSFGAATPTATGITNVTLGTAFRTLTLELDNSDLPGNSTNLQLGRWIRPNTPSANLELKDVVANFALANSIQITSVPDLAVTRAVFTERIVPESGVIAGALRIDFNNQIDNAGAVGAYTIDLVGDVATDIVVNAVSVSGNSVIIDLESPVAAVDGVSADGLLTASNGNPSEGLFRVSIDSGTGPTDIFAQQLTADVNDRGIGDEIEPALLFVSFHDLNGNGELDAVALVFDEAMASGTSIAGLSATPIDGAAVNPISRITRTGFTEDLGDFETLNIVNPASNTLTITRSAGTVKQVLDGESATPRETNNAVILNFNPRNFDWDDDGTTAAGGDTEEAIPGTGDANAVRVAYTAATQNITDQAGNAAPAVAGTDASEDRASPVLVFAGFLAGDNQDELTSNRQLVVEQRPAGDLTDVGDSDPARVLFVFSEDIQSTEGDNSVSAANVRENQIFFGGNRFQDGDLIDTLTTGNTFTLINSGVEPDNSVSILAAATLVDATGNPATSSSLELADKRAPFISLTVQSSVVVDSAFLVDTNDDGDANQIILQFSQPVVRSLLDADDLAISVGTIDSVDTDSGANSNGVVLFVSGVSMSDTPTVTYNGADADTNDRAIRSSVTNMNVSAINGQTFVAQAIDAADPTTQGPAIMAIKGRVLLSTDGGTATPAPIGTKVYATVAVPTIRATSARHNNIDFGFDRRIGSDTAASLASLEAMTNWLLELEPNVYMHRTNTGLRVLSNSSENPDAGGDYDFITDTIQLNFIAGNLAFIRYTGIGEVATNRILNGTVDLAWDVLRSADGTFSELYSSGFSFEGSPIWSQSTVTDPSGAYELYVSAPIASFTGRGRLSSQFNPVILVAELPNGQRFPVSSLMTSTEGEPIRFQPQNRNQNGTNAPPAFQFNINLDKVGRTQVYPGWNTIPFARRSGWAQAAFRRPFLPSGITNNDIVLGQNLLAGGPLDQFVYWIEDADGDGTGLDGMWTAADDRAFPLDSILVDADQIRSFAFTLTNFGVQFGPNINNLVGGYAAGFFNATDQNYGVFQLGPRLSQDSVFPAAGFPNNAVTTGWTLATVTRSFPNANGFFPANNRTDFILVFQNTGDGFNVGSLDSSNSANNPNDLSTILRDTPAFIHYR